MLSLLLSSIAGLTEWKAQAAGPNTPLGEIVYTHFGYHDTWTDDWQDYDNAYTKI